MSKATKLPTMEELHAKVAEAFVTALNDDPSPAMLNAARQFLKDNGIEVDRGSNNAMEELHKRLPEMDEIPAQDMH